MIELRSLSSVVAAYIPDGEDLFAYKEQILTTDEWNHFLPVIEHAGTKISSTIDLINIQERGKSIRSYNRNTTSLALSDEKVTDSKLDVSANELTLGSQKYVINLTQSTITIVDSSGIPKVYLPLENTSLTPFNGSILIVEINNLNTKEIASRYGGTDNYLDVYLSLIDRHDLNSKVSIKLCNMFKLVNSLYTKLEFDNITPASNSVKVVSVKEITGEYVVDMDNGKTLFDREYGMTISTKKLMHALPNPVTTKEYQFQTEFCGADTINTVRTFINDPHDEIGDRFMAVGGEVIKIVKLKDNQRPPKFHLVLRNDEGTFEYKEFFLEDLDTLPFIYKTKEEARAGMTKDRLLENELAEKKLKSEMAKINISDNIEAERLKLEREKMEWDREKQKLENAKQKIINTQTEEEMKYELYKTELEKERELMKLQMMSYNHDRTRENESMKFHYDVQRANADTTLQTLKVVGGVVALGAAAFAVYRKLS